MWRSYELEELIPFPEVDAVKISVSYTSATATSTSHAAFLIDDFSLVQRTASLLGRIDPAIARPPTGGKSPPSSNKLIPLGGRWFYEPAPGESVFVTSTPLTVTEDNADRLFYKSDHFLNPFLEQHDCLASRGI